MWTGCSPSLVARRAPTPPADARLSSRREFEKPSLPMTFTSRILPVVKRSPQPLSRLSPTHNSFSLPQFLDPSSHLLVNKNNNHQAGLSTQMGSGGPPAAAEATQVFWETTHPQHLCTTLPGEGCTGADREPPAPVFPGGGGHEKETPLSFSTPRWKTLPGGDAPPPTSPSPNEVPKCPPLP